MDANFVDQVILLEHLSNQKCPSCHTDHKGLKPEMSLGNCTREMLPVNIINNCNSCHCQPSDNLHKLLFAECNNCHNTEGWKSAVIFNHEMVHV